jgi:hypothetical protein
MVEIEARPYGPDSSPEEVAALRQRANLVAGGIVSYAEVPVVTEFTVNLFFDWVSEQEPAIHTLILDLSGGGRPASAARRALKRRLAALPEIKCLRVVFAGNLIVKVAFKFVVGSSFGRATHVYDSVEDAVRAALQ